MSLVVACGDDEAEPASSLDGGLEDAGPIDAALDANAIVLQGRDETVTLTHAGAERSLLLHIPASYDGSKAVPLVVDVHGLGGSAEYQRSTSGWLAKSDEQGFLLAYPQGLRFADAGSQSWNAGSLCCGDSLKNMVDDEGFMLALVAELKSKKNVDAKRVYATGLSNGGGMAHLLACRAANVFAAVAPASMSNSTMPCEPARGIPVVMFRATGDTLVPYGASDSKFATAEADFESWKTRNQCTGQPTISHDGACKTYSDCKDAAEVTLCSITTGEEDAPWGGHLMYPYAARQNVDFVDQVWSVFERHALP